MQIDERLPAHLDGCGPSVWSWILQEHVHEHMHVFVKLYDGMVFDDTLCRERLLVMHKCLYLQHLNHSHAQMICTTLCMSRLPFPTFVCCQPHFTLNLNV